MLCDQLKVHTVFTHKFQNMVLEKNTYKSCFDIDNQMLYEEKNQQSLQKCASTQEIRGRRSSKHKRGYLIFDSNDKKKTNSIVVIGEPEYPNLISK